MNPVQCTNLVKNRSSIQTTKIHKNCNLLTIKCFKVCCVLRGAFSYVDKTIRIRSSYSNSLPFLTHKQRPLIPLDTAYKQGYIYIYINIFISFTMYKKPVILNSCFMCKIDYLTQSSVEKITSIYIYIYTFF